MSRMFDAVSKFNFDEDIRLTSWLLTSKRSISGQSHRTLPKSSFPSWQFLSHVMSGKLEPGIGYCSRDLCIYTAIAEVLGIFEVELEACRI